MRRLGTYCKVATAIRGSLGQAMIWSELLTGFPGGVKVIDVLRPGIVSECKQSPICGGVHCYGVFSKGLLWALIPSLVP